MIAGSFAPTGALWRRDLVRTMRKRRTAVFLGIYVGILAILIISNWPSINMTPYMVQRYAQDSLAFFTVLSYIWMVIVMPPYGAASLTQEHERETMEMLSLTLVPPWGVIVGKVGAHTGLFLFVLLAAMPVMGASTFFTVGTEIPTFIALVGLIASTSIACVTIGVACSSIAKSSKAAVIFSYIGVAMMLGLPILLFAAAVELVFQWDWVFGIDSEEALMFLVRYFTPLGATAFLLNESFNGFDYVCVQLYLGGVVLCSILFACWRFSRLNKKGLIARRVEKAAATREKKRRPRTFRPLPNGGNPWFAREVRFGTLTRGRVRFGVFGGGCLVFGLIAFSFSMVHYRDGGSGDEYIQAWIGVCLLALAVVMPGIAANTFTREFDGARMDLLRGTLLTTRQYVLGSIRSSLRSVMPLLMAIALTTLLLLPIYASSRNGYESIVTGCGTAATTIVLATTIGVATGTIIRRTTTALMLAYVAVFTMFLGAWLGVFFVGEFIAQLSVRAGTHTYNDAPRLLALRELVGISSPVVAYITNLDASRRNDMVSPYWIRSVALGCAYAVAFTAMAIAGFRIRMARDA